MPEKEERYSLSGFIKASYDLFKIRVRNGNVTELSLYCHWEVIRLIYTEREMKEYEPSGYWKRRIGLNGNFESGTFK